MKTKGWLIVCLVILIVGIAIGGTAVWCLKKKSQPVFLPGKPIYVQKIVPNNCDEYKYCAELPLGIKYLWQYPYMTVTAGNECAEIKQTYKIELPEKKNIFTLYPIIGIDYKHFGFVYGGGIAYSRRVMPVLFLGIGFQITNQEIFIYPKLDFIF